MRTHFALGIHKNNLETVRHQPKIDDGEKAKTFHNQISFADSRNNYVENISSVCAVATREKNFAGNLRFKSTEKKNRKKQTKIYIFLKEIKYERNERLRLLSEFYLKKYFITFASQKNVWKNTKKKKNFRLDPYASVRLGIFCLNLEAFATSNATLISIYNAILSSLFDVTRKAQRDTTTKEKKKKKKNNQKICRLSGKMHELCWFIFFYNIQRDVVFVSLEFRSDCDSM